MRILKINSNRIAEFIQEDRRKGITTSLIFYDADDQGRIFKIGYCSEPRNIKWIYADECEIEIIGGNNIVGANEDFIADLIVKWHLPNEPEGKHTTSIRGIVYNYKKAKKERKI